MLVLENLTSITLCNNAGSLGEMQTLGNLDSEKIQDIIQLNTTTPIILSNEFSRLTKKLTCKKQIISISSGAAVNAYAGWSLYCASKAALEMMTKTLATEQNDSQYGIKSIAIKPGVVDTNMQTQIRNTPASAFKHVQRFKELKQNNELYSARFVASKIYQIDSANKLQNGEIIDLRTLQPLDEDLIISTVNKHGRCLIVTEEPVSNSFAQSVAARVSDKCFEQLDAPVKVVGSEDMPAIPLNSTLEETMIPNKEKVAEALEALLNY